MTDYPPQYFLSEGPDSIAVKVIRSLAGSETVVEIPRRHGAPGSPASDRATAQRVMDAFMEVDRLSRPAPGDLTGAYPPPRIEVTDQLAQRLADRFWAIIQEQRHGADGFASILAEQTQSTGGGWGYFKRALEEALNQSATQSVDLRFQFPEIASKVFCASAAWPGDYSSIAVALMDGCTTMQPNAADAIASLILLLQSVTKSPELLSTELQAKAREARALRVQQGDNPQWSQG